MVVLSQVEDKQILSHIIFSQQKEKLFAIFMVRNKFYKFHKFEHELPYQLFKENFIQRREKKRKDKIFIRYQNY